MKYLPGFIGGFASAVLAAFLLFAAHRASLAPGTAPHDVFHDGEEWYSQDGCWHLQNGYWRPLRRCNIVRVPAP